MRANKYHENDSPLNEKYIKLYKNSAFLTFYS